MIGRNAVLGLLAITVLSSCRFDEKALFGRDPELDSSQQSNSNSNPRCQSAEMIRVSGGGKGCTEPYYLEDWFYDIQQGRDIVGPDTNPRPEFRFFFKELSDSGKPSMAAHAVMARAVDFEGKLTAAPLECKPVTDISAPAAAVAVYDCTLAESADVKTGMEFHVASIDLRNSECSAPTEYEIQYENDESCSSVPYVRPTVTLGKYNLEPFFPAKQ